MANIITSQDIIGWTAVVTAAVSTVGGVALLRRRLSRDRTEMTKDRAESAFITQLLKERDAAVTLARDAWRDRQTDVESIARLQAQNAYQQSEIERLKAEFGSLKRLIARLYPETRVFLESDFQRLPADDDKH